MKTKKSPASKPKKLPVSTRKQVSPLLLIFSILGVLSAAVVLVVVMKATAPKPKEEAVEKPIPSVRIKNVTSRSTDLQVATQGTVAPRTQTTLVAEVSGRILDVTPAMEAGAFFKKGDLLLRIDPRDYETALTNALAEVARAEADYAMEKAEAEQARLDWERMGKQGEPSDLLLRLPQLARAEAALSSARAAVEKARHDLERTRITAPYDGRSREKMAEVGQFANVGTQLGRIFATDYVEIRLPLSDDELGKLDPGLLKYRDEAWENGPKVIFTGDVAGKEQQWEGRITRLEGVVDEKSRFYYAVARVDDPYGTRIDRDIPLTVGMFVDALIEGRRVSDVAVLPRSALHPGDNVYLVDADNRLQIRTVKVISANDNEVVIRDGLGTGDRVAITPLAKPVDGMKLAVLSGDDSTEKRAVAQQEVSP